MEYQTTLMQFNNILKNADIDNQAIITFESDFRGNFLKIKIVMMIDFEFEIVLRDGQIIKLANFIKTNIESQRGNLL